ncbi:MAG: N-acetyltransferase [Alphaproteobacteria bacterium]|nr:N-acetyltransferase [Alphaproteobacteria bacterium]
MYVIANERRQDADEIETLLDRAFGADRHAKTSYRLREGVAPIDALCFTGRADGVLKATIRYWPVSIAGQEALLLGPLAIEPAERGKGYGVALMWHSLAAARALGHRLVILVGDPEYYERFGFRRAVAERLVLPGPVEARRFLGLELAPGAARGLKGAVEKSRSDLAYRRTA